jgi:hypothetical protein
MKRVILNLVILVICSMFTVQNALASTDLSNEVKILPDKTYEVVVPLLFLLLISNIFITIRKNRADREIKERLIELGISEEALIAIFKESNKMASLQPLKWCIFGLAGSLSLLFIHLTKNVWYYGDGLLATGIILLFFSIAFLIFQVLLNKRLR